MSQKEYIEYRENLNKGLKESYEKMLRLKMKLGQDIVTSDEHGRPVTISAEKAWEQYQKTRQGSAN